MELTELERHILNGAFTLLQRINPENAHFTLSMYGRYDDVAYFDSRDIDAAFRAHHWIEGETFADKVQACIDIENNLPSEEDTRNARIAQLRAELGKLENEA